VLSEGDRAESGNPGSACLFRSCRSHRTDHDFSLAAVLAAYHDQHTIFKVPKTVKQTIDEQLAGRRTPTQLGRVFEELGITSIAARSPQAKGRIERLFGTLQSRLVAELRLAGIATLEDANAFLPAFLTRFNRTFRISATQRGSSYRHLEPGMIPIHIFCFKYVRTVGSDNVVCFGDRRLQIGPCHGRMSYARARVEVHERLDGSIGVYYQGRLLVTASAPLETPLLRARSRYERPRRTNNPTVAAEDVGMLATPSQPAAARDPGRQHVHIPWKPPPNHPWRR
jgi:hypothetical protein